MSVPVHVDVQFTSAIADGVGAKGGADEAPGLGEGVGKFTTTDDAENFADSVPAPTYCLLRTADGELRPGMFTVMVMLCVAAAVLARAGPAGGVTAA